MQQQRQMTLKSIDSRQETIYRRLHHCRESTLALFEGVDRQTFCNQAHPDFSPIGWHLGHIAYTESLWILQYCARKSPQFKEYHRLLAAKGLPKEKRCLLPTLAEIKYYLDIIRSQVLEYLEIAPLDKQERLWRWLIQHESQHSETIAFLLQLQRSPFQNSSIKATNSLSPEIIEIPAGEFTQGNNAVDALDNERPAHRVYLESYSIDRYPITCKEYREFMQAGGYQHHQWWSDAGWEWLQANLVTQPLYWLDDRQWDNHPVCGVSWYEAEAYTNFVGKRLPTEAEWEKAASFESLTQSERIYPWGDTFPDSDRCNHNNAIGQTTPVNAYPNGQSAYGLYDTLGNVWEWTATWFDGYQGFVNYPYPGYSQVYFDGKHRVLKGGSWATQPWAMRNSFRNWYHPGVRQIFAGFRCAKSA